MNAAKARAGVAAAATSQAARWAAIEALLHEALAQEPSERERFLAASCSDPETRREVAALIDSHEERGQLDVLAESVIAPLLPSDAPSRRRATAAPGVPALARFRVIDRLGGGGMGLVYRAYDERLEREVALKFLPPHLSSDEAAKKRFFVEARAAASLDHPNICTVHEIGDTDDGQLYIVMACYAGETLDRRIARGPLPLAEAIGIAADVARGLAKAHERGIVHRDIKPANIMITGDGVVKILDFGIAKLADTNVTQTGGIIGTIAYMSPEQAFGETVDCRTDVWSLGVALYEMLTGARPFQGPGEQALLFAILTQEPESLGAVLGEVPGELEAILRRALAKRPAERFASAQEMLVALEGTPSFAGLRPGPTRAAHTPPASPPADSLLTRAGERRQATVVVTGISDYAALVERFAPEELARIVTGVRDAAVDAATRQGGIVNHFAGDDTVMLFGVTAAHEDDFLRAVRATLDLHARVRALDASVRMRSGVHTGPVVAQRQRAGDRRFLIAGSPPDVAARLAALAEADGILISPECHRLVAPFVRAVAATPVVLQPESGSVTPLRVLGESDIHTRLELAERSGLTPFAGRARELATLEEQVAAAARGAGGVTVVLGEAGSGKSRLLYELRRRIDPTSTRLALGRCDAFGGTTPYLPFVQSIRELLGLTGAETPAEAHEIVVARVQELDPSLRDFLPLYLALLSVPSETFPVPRHLAGAHLQAAMLEALSALITVQAHRRTTVLLLEDWHWADEASRAALDQLGAMAPAHRLSIIVSCRPEPGVAWTASEHRALMHLGPLGSDTSLEIIRAVLHVAVVAPTLAEQLHERTGGNPFFLEESCQALVEEGAVIVRDGEARAVGDSGRLHLPETVQAVIRTRLDRLDGEARDALRMASVIGREFSRPLLDEVASGVDLSAALDRLRATGLIQQTSVIPEAQYRFKHILTQEVAYETLLEHQRRTLHTAAARAIERRHADRLDEHLERLAHHFSRAEEWRSAVEYGIRAADRAQALSQFADALATLDNVQTWLRHLPHEAERRELLSDILLRQERVCETLGLRARQLRIIEELIAHLAPFGASAKLAEAYLRQGDVCTLLRRYDAADRALGTSLRISRERGDAAGERNAHRSIGLLRSHSGRYEEAIESLERVLAIDRALGERAAAAGDLASLGNVYRNMGQPERALRPLEDALQDLDRDEDATKRGAVMTVIGHVYRELGDVETAVAYLERTSREAVERRLPIVASFSLLALAHIHLQQGRAEESLRTYRDAVELSRRARHGEGLAQALRALSEVLFGFGRFDEATPLLREAATLFAQLEDRETEALMYARAASALERCGHVAAARAEWETAREKARRLGDARGAAAALEGIARAIRRDSGPADAVEPYQEALRETMHLNDAEVELSLRNSLGILHWEMGDFAAALGQYEAALRLCRALEDRVHEGLILNSLGATLLRLARWDEARTALEESVRLNGRNGQRQLEGHALAALGDVCLATGRADEARAHFSASLALRRDVGDRLGEGWMLERMARAAEAAGAPEEAGGHRAAALAIGQDVGDRNLLEALARGAAHDGITSHRS